MKNNMKANPSDTDPPAGRIVPRLHFPLASDEEMEAFVGDRLPQEEAEDLEERVAEHPALHARLLSAQTAFRQAMQSGRRGVVYLRLLPDPSVPGASDPGNSGAESATHTIPIGSAECCDVGDLIENLEAADDEPLSCHSILTLPGGELSLTVAETGNDALTILVSSQHESHRGKRLLLSAAGWEMIADFPEGGDLPLFARFDLSREQRVAFKVAVEASQKPGGREVVE
jgi:hypothetical protein